MIRSLLLGFGTGTLFFLISPLGLGIAMVEFFKPVLAPGVSLVVLFSKGGGGPLLLPIGLILNGLTYSVFFLSLGLVNLHLNQHQILARIAVVLGFLTATGMLYNVILLLTSPDKSWIFQVGA